MKILACIFAVPYIIASVYFFAIVLFGVWVEFLEYRSEKRIYAGICRTIFYLVVLSVFALFMPCIFLLAGAKDFHGNFVSDIRYRLERVRESQSGE